MGSISSLKRQTIEQLLQMEDFILMVIMPTCEGVALPDDLMSAGEPVGINVGLKMAIPVPDLLVNDDGISGTLSFNRTPFHCTFPWRSIVQVSADQEHLIWVEPPVDADELGDGKDAGPEPDGEGKPHLKLV